MARTVPEWIGKTDDAKVPPRVRQRIFDAHEGRCHLSGREIRPGEAWELEHKVALILGGEHREKNLAPALVEFHKAKTAAEMKIKAKIAAVRKKHVGITQPKGEIKSPGFAKTSKSKQAEPPRLGAGTPTQPAFYEGAAGMKPHKFQTPYHYWPSAQALGPAAPCPFCKSPNVMMYDGKDVAMNCVDCGAEGPPAKKRGGSMYPHRTAWENWNRAASPAPPVEETADKIEKAAKAMFEFDWPKDKWERLGAGYHRDRYKGMVRAALTAIGARDE